MTSVPINLAKDTLLSSNRLLDFDVGHVALAFAESNLDRVLRCSLEPEGNLLKKRGQTECSTLKITPT